MPAASSDDDASARIERAEFRRIGDPLLVSYLDREPQVATRAALALGRIGDRAAVEPLRAHLGAASPSVRAIAAFSLGLLAAPDALEREVALAKRDPNSAVRYAAVDAIGRIAYSHPTLMKRALADDVVAVARSDDDAIVRAHAIAQLETFAAQPYASTIVTRLATFALHDRDANVRWHAMWALYRGYATRVEPAALRAALASPVELVRVEALRAYGRRTDADRTTIARIARDDPSWRVALEAHEVLRHLRGLPHTEHLVADPPGLALPFVPTPTSAPASAPAPSASRPAAPDPATVSLGVPLLPTDAAQMDGPLPGLHPRALIATTAGDVVVRLYPEWSPGTVANFLGLAARGYFDGNRWFRIVPDFVVQTGDPHDDGNGDAGYAIPAEENPLEQRSYVISMGLDYAHDRAIRDSAGTQFYFTLSPQLHLDRAFTTFGEVESGFGVLAHLVERDRIVRVRRLADD